MKFKSLGISKWQQFKDINIQFHDRLTILTGANGAGKTTLLSYVLGRHCSGWNIPLSSTPKYDKAGKLNFLTRWAGYVLGSNSNDSEQESVIGNLYYDNDEFTLLKVPNRVANNNPQYHIAFSAQQQVNSVFVPSHRSILSHRNIDSMPMQKKTMEQTFQETIQSTKQRLLGNQPEPTSLVMKRTILGWVMQGYSTPKNAGDPEQVKFIEGFEEVLRKVLPKNINFQNLEVRNNEIVFSCNDGNDEFIFEQASGGLGAIIDIVWQIYSYSTKENGNFTALIDEVENHLHPTMQRRILPDLLAAFPHVTFIVSTHSPLVISSVKNSNVYALRYDEEGKVYSQPIDLVNEAKTANEVLDEVLGVSFTMPIWAEEALEGVLMKYKKIDSADKLKMMRQELADNGLEKMMPEAINELYDDKTN